MNIMSLRAKTQRGEDFVFKLTDIPVLVDDKHFVLFGKKNSPILLTEGIVSGADIDGIFEGTVIRDTYGSEYLISFKRGFAAMDMNKTVYKLNDIHDFTIVPSYIRTAPSTCRYRILYKYENIQFGLQDIVGVLNDKLVIKEHYKQLDISKVQQYAGLYLNGQRVYFGDYIKDKMIEMWNGRVGYWEDDAFYDLADKSITRRT